MKVYGPYRRPDGRQHVIHYDEVTKKRRTQSYPRYLMEKALGRVLEPWEHVDHINNDPTEDRLDNLQILTQAANNEKFAKTRKAWIYKECVYCGAGFLMLKSRFESNQIKQGKAGPYCSKSCAGKVHH